MATKFEKFERIFRCERCKHKFVKHVTADEMNEVKCPRSCAAKIADITEAEEQSIEKHRADKQRRQEEKQLKAEAEAAAKVADLKKGKK